MRRNRRSPPRCGRIERAAGALATPSVARMDETLPWFRALPADQRVLGHAGRPGRRPVAGGVAAIRRHDAASTAGDLRRGLRGRARGRWPGRSRCSQTVAADQGDHRRGRGARCRALAAAGEEEALRRRRCCGSPGRSRSRAARVYARAAESRGAWDARLQALLVDALLRGDSSDVLASRAAALGWADAPPVAVVVGRSPGGDITAVLHAVLPGRPGAARRRGASAGCTATGWSSCSAGPTDPLATAEQLLAELRRRAGRGRAGGAVAGPGDRVGPGGAGRLPGGAGLAGRARARWPPTTCCPSGRWPATRRPAGCCGTTCTARWPGPAAELLETLDAFFAAGGVLESAARALYVHPNTVRYRLQAGRRGHRAVAAGRRGTRSRCGSRWRSAGSIRRRSTALDRIRRHARSFTYDRSYKTANRGIAGRRFVGTLQRWS